MRSSVIDLQEVEEERKQTKQNDYGKYLPRLSFVNLKEKIASEKEKIKKKIRKKKVKRNKVVPKKIYPLVFKEVSYKNAFYSFIIAFVIFLIEIINILYLNNVNLFLLLLALI